MKHLSSQPDLQQDLASITALPRGFRFSGLHAGIKRTRRDLGLILCPEGATVAGCVTQNQVRATCIDRMAALLPSGAVSAVVINSGNANAMTGERGVQADLAVVSSAATAIGCAPDAVLTSSTGVIGVPLDSDTIASAMPKLVENATHDPKGLKDLAHAILTTDTGTKVASLELRLPGHDETITLLGIAKGSGMVHPNMATTLGFVCTDAKIPAELLQLALSSVINRTFNAITVDGDTSTNDCVLALASQRRGDEIEEGPALEAFTRGLKAVLLALAIQIAQDGEGATRLLEVQVSGAPTEAAAQAVARGICRGSLFKCSVFAGEAAGWGRLAAAAGQAALEAKIPLRPEKISISAQGIPLVESGVTREQIEIAELSRRLRDARVLWEIDLGAGDESFTAFGCDLSYDYVRINADEALQVEITPEGQIGRNLSLSSYSPSLKHQLLVDGLGYARRFTGLRVMVHLSGAVTHKPALLAALARDLELLLDAGMRPLLALQGDAAAALDPLAELMQQGPYALAKVIPEPAAIGPRLDRGQACVTVQTRPDPGGLVELAIRVGVGKLLSLADDQGLRDKNGLVTQLSPEQTLAGLHRSRFETVADENLAFARHAAMQGLPALHLIDGRIPHALVAELFTNRGVGTLVTRLYSLYEGTP